MTIPLQHLPPPEARDRGRAVLAVDRPQARRSPLAVLAIQDLILAGYMLVVAALLGWRAPAAGPGPVMLQVLACLVLVPATAWFARCAVGAPRWLRLNAYRVVIVGAIVWSYLMLRDVLPVVRPDSVDASLSAWDQRLFGVQPALWLERFNRRPIVEWFSFFYFNYYTILLANVVGAVWITRRTGAASELGLGTALAFAIGHLGYMAVPGAGPVVYLADRFHGPLDGGVFWGLVSRSVASGGALKDVFPSMHTGASTWLALFAVHQATIDRRWRVPAAITCFFAANIVVSTLLLRWHYAVDVVAGLALASGVALLAARVVPWEEARRRRLGLPPVWPEV